MVFGQGLGVFEKEWNVVKIVRKVGKDERKEGTSGRGGNALSQWQ